MLLVARCARTVRASGYTVETEPAIKTDHGVRRPDVVAYKPGTEAVIVDLTVIADLPGKLPDAHARKCRKCDVPDCVLSQWAHFNVHTACEHGGVDLMGLKPNP